MLHTVAGNFSEFELSPENLFQKIASGEQNALMGMFFKNLFQRVSVCRETENAIIKSKLPKFSSKFLWLTSLTHYMEILFASEFSKQNQRIKNLISRLPSLYPAARPSFISRDKHNMTKFTCSSIFRKQQRDEELIRRSCRHLLGFACRCMLLSNTLRSVNFEMS